MHWIKQGDFMAFLSIFGDNVSNCSTVALKDSTICMIEKKHKNNY